MKRILFVIAVLGAAAGAQVAPPPTTVIIRPDNTIPPPDIVGAVAAGQQAQQQAQNAAAQRAMVRQQAEILKRQNANLQRELSSQTQASSRHTNGSDLQDWCQAALNHEIGARAGLCVGYINSFRELAGMLPDANLLCLPDGVSNDQFIKVLLKYLDQHPERLHIIGPRLIYDATSESFPCSTAKK